MIIFGSRNRIKEVARGVFLCPFCRSRQPYVLKRAGQYFTLYFIPLFQIKNLGEFVECQNCAKTFNPEVLNLGQGQPG
jgi:hypothetical protein